MTAATAAATAATRMNGGKMLCRIDLDDPAPSPPWKPCARAIDELAAHGLIAMVEPFMSTRVERQGPQRPVPRRGDQVDAHRPGPGLDLARTPG